MEEEGHARAQQARMWDDFVATAGDQTGFMQTSWWAEFLEKRGWGHFGAVFKDGNTPVGGAQILTHTFDHDPDKGYYYIPDGPILPENKADAEQVFTALLAYADRKRQDEAFRVSHLRIESRWTHCPGFVQGFQATRDWFEPRSTLYIDLTPDIDAILAQMKPKGRYNIGLARKHGVSVIEDCSPQGVADFLAIYEEMVARKEMRRRKSPKYLRSVFDTLTAVQHGSLYFAEYRGMRLAAALIAYFGNRMTFFFGGSRAIHRDVMAPYLLHFEIMRQGKAKGYHWYDFYGAAPPGAENHRWASISIFKRKFGGVDVSFVPGLDLVYDPDDYAVYRGQL